MKSVKYVPLSELLEKFEDAAESISEDLRDSEISWGSGKQMTLADATYVHDIIEQRVTAALDDIDAKSEDEADKALRKQAHEYLLELTRLRAGPTMYYCMEE